MQGAPRVTLQGNLDPSVLYAPEHIIRARTTQMIQAFGTGGGHIANLGHGMMPDHDPEALRIFLETVRNASTVKRNT
jgi:uroporphyrinogen decarboxylase